MLTLPYYKEEPEIRVATAILCYIDRIKPFRNSTDCNNLFITFKKPYHNATSQTIARWRKQTMFNSGIDTNQFTAHSTRHASTSLTHS